MLVLTVLCNKKESHLKTLPISVINQKMWILQRRRKQHLGSTVTPGSHPNIKTLGAKITSEEAPSRQDLPGKDPRLIQ